MRRLAALCMLTLLGRLLDRGRALAAVAILAQQPDVAVAHPRFGDSEPHEWDSGAPWNYAVHGTDVSKYQTSVDWQPAKASGISFAFIKATEGGDRVDDYFDEHWRATKAAGIPRARLSFLLFLPPAAEQARWFIQNVPNDRSALPPVLDMEWNPQSPTCKLRPAAGNRAQRDEHLPDDRREALRQEADHLHLDRLLRRQRPVDLPRLSLLAALGRRPSATRSTAATPSPSGSTPEQASCRA